MVYVLLATGFEETEALVPVDLLRRANIETALVALEGSWVEGGHGITVKADLTVEQVDLEQADLLMLPGGGLGYRNLGASSAVETLVKQAAQRSIPIAAICAAPTLLGKWGLLAGKKAICYPTMTEGLTGAEVCPDCGVVQDGTIITGRAAGSATEFGLKLVELLAGAEKAEEVRGDIYFG